MDWRELAAEVGVCHKTVVYILHDILGYRKLAARLISYEISEVQQWHRYAVAQALLDRHKREGDNFHGRIVVAMNKTWVRSYEQNINGGISVLLVQIKFTLQNVL